MSPPSSFPSSIWYNPRGWYQDNHKNPHSIRDHSGHRRSQSLSNIRTKILPLRRDYCPFLRLHTVVLHRPVARRRMRSCLALALGLARARVRDARDRVVQDRWYPGWYSPHHPPCYSDHCRYYYRHSVVDWPQSATTAAVGSLRHLPHTK